MYLELAGDSGLSEQLAATARSMVCCFWRSDDAFSTGAFGQVCIAVRRVLLGRLSQGQDRCPKPPVSYWRQGGSTPLWLSLRGPTTPRIARPLRPHWCALRRSNRPLPMHRSRIDCVLLAISSRRLLIFSSADHDDLGFPRHLRRDAHRFASAYFARGRGRGDRERATRRFHVRGRQGPGLELGPVRAPGAHVVRSWGLTDITTCQAITGSVWDIMGCECRLCLGPKSANT